MSWIDLIKALVPIIITAKVPHGDVIAPLVTHGITTAEEMVGASSSVKLDKAQDLVHTGIAGINAAAGTIKVDPTAVDQALASGISTVVNVANLIHKN